LTRGFVYSDCWVEDARLVVLNAMDAAARGAAVLTRTRCVSARPGSGGWEATLVHGRSGQRQSVRARVLVNATGPWAASFLEQALALPQRRGLRLIKGSHIVVPRLYAGEHAYILQNRDRRIVFAIPYEGRFTLVGTTDVDFAGDPATARISPAEVDYLCDVINRYFVPQIGPQDVVWSYSGVRPLYGDEAENAAAVTRDYTIEVDVSAGAPLLSVFGGKITTYRRLAEQAMERLRPFFAGIGDPWTATAPLPGGDIPDADFDGFLGQLQARMPWLPPPLAHRYGRAYGTRVYRLLHDAAGLQDLGRHFGEDLYEREVAYLIQEEWAQTAEDILWRRSKLGLHLSAATQANLEDWMGAAAIRSQAAAQ
jgi:glycerol-3-phosphate dehydrogenase